VDLEQAKKMQTPASTKVNVTLSVASFLLVVMMVSVFWSNLREYRQIVEIVEHTHLNSPHYRGLEGMRHCDDCHAYPSDMCESHGKAECLDCHSEDGKARQLRYASVLILCTNCHAPDVFVAYAGEDGRRHEVDVTHNHPYGMEMTDVTFPKSLPLSEFGGLICTTCHDVHIQDESMKMLRIFKPANGHPEDVKPLCHDCHHQNGVL